VKNNINKKYLFLDFETHLVSSETPWESPKPVCLSWCSSDMKIIGISDNVENNLSEGLSYVFELMFEKGYDHVWQNGYNFDLLVIWDHFPEHRENLLRALDGHRIHDTLIRERLYDLSTVGEISQKKGRYGLANMVKKYLGRDISHLKKGDDIWRLRYAELDGIPINKYPKEAYSYAVEDSIDGMKVFLAQEANRADKGPGSMNTEELQIKSAFALNLAYKKGLKVNKEKLEKLAAEIDVKLEPLQKFLIDRGFAQYDKKGKYIKRQKEFMLYLQKNYPDFIKLTGPTKKFPNGQIRTDDDALALFPPDEIVHCRKDMSLLEKYKGTYIKNIEKAGYRFRAQYDILKETGRTSSFIQTMPKDGGIRDIFEADDHHVLGILDYAHIEADAMAQTYKNLGLSTGLLDYLNTGADYHSLIGSSWYNSVHNSKLSPREFESRKGDPDINKYRTFAKPAGLGFSGGIGPNTLKTTAKGQGVELSLDESIESLRFAESSIPGLTDFRGVWKSSEKGWLGKQKLVNKKCLGTYKNENGKEVPLMMDYYGYEVNGRYRNNCTYCSLANGISMQGPAADGAKEAIWECFKYAQKHDIYFVFFIHDELGFLVPETTVVNEEGQYEAMTMIHGPEIHLKNLADLMCKGMQKILPDVRITVEGGIYEHWTKDESKAKFKLKAWRTPEGKFEYV
jgi:DNA polymerase I